LEGGFIFATLFKGHPFLHSFPFIDILTPATPGVIGKETPYGKTQTFNTG